MIMPLGQYLTLTEAAKEIGISRPQLSNYITAGRLNPIEVGNQKLLKRSDVRKFRRNPPGNPNWRKKSQKA